MTSAKFASAASGPEPVEPTLYLMTLGEGMPGVTPEWGHFLAQACIVCLNYHGHISGVRLHSLKSKDNPLISVAPRFSSSKGNFPDSFEIIWDIEMTAQMVSAWGDMTEATQFGACGLAMVLLLELTPFTVIERSYKTTGVDYFLGHREAEEPLEMVARMEVSGLLRASDGEVRTRSNQKLRQTSPSDGTTPAIIIVPEFGKPKVQVLEKR